MSNSPNPVIRLLAWKQSEKIITETDTALFLHSLTSVVCLFRGSDIRGVSVRCGTAFSGVCVNSPRRRCLAGWHTWTEPCSRRGTSASCCPAAWTDACSDRTEERPRLNVFERQRVTLMIVQILTLRRRIWAPSSCSPSSPGSPRPSALELEDSWTR